MSWLVIACGVLLAAGGGYSIVSGAPYMQVEFGWTEVIAGTTALAGGIVTIALGAVLYRLGALQKAVAQAVMPAATQTSDTQTSDAQISEAPAAVAPPLFVPTLDRSDVDAAEVGPLPADLYPPSPPAADVPPPRSRVSGLWSRFRSNRKTPDLPSVSLPEPPMEPRLGAPAPLTAAASSSDAMPDAAPPVASPAETEAEARGEPPPDTGGRDIVGRYEAGEASYVLFSDGTIEVETATGIHRFASMEELKAFVERQDAEKAATDR